MGFPSLTAPPVRRQTHRAWLLLLALSGIIGGASAAVADTLFPSRCDVLRQGGSKNSAG